MEATQQTMTSVELSMLLARPGASVMLISVLLVIVGIIEGFIQEWGNGPFLLIFGALASVLAMFRYGRGVSRGEAPGPGLVGMVPYAFGMYLFFYRGIWDARELLEEFSFTRVLISLVFMYLGYRVLHHVWIVTEIIDAVRKGKIQVVDADPKTAPDGLSGLPG